ncbi:MAG: endonuclease dU [Promethearchaeota archaeon]
MFLNIKSGIFSVAIDDAIHERGEKHTELFFIFCRGQFLEKILHTTINVDGFDATEEIISTLKPFRDRFAIIITHGITVGGFNLIDIEKVCNGINRPVIAVTENKPAGGNAMREALKNLPECERRLQIFDRAGDIFSVKTDLGQNKLHYHIMGLDESSARKFLKKFAIRSRLPEQLLLAHKIASGWKLQ